MKEKMNKAWDNRPRDLDAGYRRQQRFVPDAETKRLDYSNDLPPCGRSGRAQRRGVPGGKDHGSARANNQRFLT
jgi:hypothetical protein